MWSVMSCKLLSRFFSQFPAAPAHQRVAAPAAFQYARFRDIKTTMGMDVLRAKRAAVVLKEIYMHLLAYNLVRSVMWHAASRRGLPLHRLSLAGTMYRLNGLEPYLQVYEGGDKAARLYTLPLKWIADDLLPDRPNRLAPRAVKRRPNEYDLLNRPRHQMRKALLCK